MAPVPIRDEMDRALAHLASRNFAPKNVADIGASTGSWSIKASEHFPGAQFFLFEPLSENEHYLKALQDHDPRFRYFLTAIGAEPGESTIFVTPDREGVS